MYIIFEGVMLLALAGLLTIRSGASVCTILLKSAASCSFVLAGFCGYIKDRDGREISAPMLPAFLCSMAGDVLLALDKGRGILFLLGVACFTAAHIFFSLAFCRISYITAVDVFGALVVFAELVLLLLSGCFSFGGLFPVLAGYAAVLSFMAVKALSLWRCRRGRKRAVILMMAGGVLFLCSDIALLFWMFGSGMPGIVRTVNWIFYYFAQGCLSASLSVRNKIS